MKKRLKLPEAWRNEVNAEHMLARRINLAKGAWHDYWATNLRDAVCRGASLGIARQSRFAGTQGPVLQ